MTLPVKPKVYREMWERVRSLQRENDKLKRKLRQAYADGERQKMDDQQKQAQRLFSDEMLKNG